MNFGNDLQGRRHRVGFAPNYGHMPTKLHFVNYSEVRNKMVEKHPDLYPPEDLINHLSMLENPLQKNLADTVHGYEVKQPFYTENNKGTIEETEKMDASTPYPSLMGIGNFFSGFFNMLTGGTFRRAKSPTFNESSNTNNCKSWLNANTENTTCTQYEGRPSQNNISGTENVKEMADCKTAVTQLENKIASVKSMLASKAAPVKTSPRLRRPKKLFVQANQVTESKVQEPANENIALLANDTAINCLSPIRNVTGGFVQACSEKTRSETAKMQLEVVKTEVEVPETVPEIQELESMDIAKPVELEKDIKTEVISSCEDKILKLKALISERRKNNRMVHNSAPESESTPDVKAKPIEMKTHNRRYKNPNRIAGGRVKTNLKKTIEEDMTFANEVDVDSAENSTQNSPINSPLITLTSPAYTELVESPTEYFNEVTGRFHNNSTTESEDSFQIVFTDSPQLSPKMRRQSDCDSEDSFIVFEDHDCYTSTDVFGDSETDYTTDDDDDKITHAFSRTVSDLTDESLYEDGEARSRDEVDHVCEVMDTGLMIDAAKKMKRKDQPPKQVRFAEGPPRVHVMRVWTYAARRARMGDWEQRALDRDRFKRRIVDVDVAISWVLKPQHRSRVMFQRFMPWWHAQKRQEAAQKKLEAARKKKEEEERKIKEEEDRLLREEEEKKAQALREFEEMLSQKKRSNFVGRKTASGINLNSGGEDTQKIEEDVEDAEEEVIRNGQELDEKVVNGEDSEDTQLTKDSGENHIVVKTLVLKANINDPVDNAKHITRTEKDKSHNGESISHMDIKMPVRNSTVLTSDAQNCSAITEQTKALI